MTISHSFEEVEIPAPVPAAPPAIVMTCEGGVGGGCGEEKLSQKGALFVVHPSDHLQLL